ncbi:MAG: hypothetical protein RMK18_05015 [Armatimonadota bacterium]|nr:hypothetical protein [Armatimonadota bacterium]MCX7776644.1 hypothetical protein [Armatimonadota bacterium]MDW8025212.1 hypothetical protein [Armatimonadota bacterium]
MGQTKAFFITLVLLASLAFLDTEASCQLPEGEMLEEPRLAHSDVLSPYDTAYDLLAKLAGSGMLEGYSGRLFNSGTVYTRQQVASLLAMALHPEATERAARRSKTLVSLSGDEGNLLLWRLATQFGDELRADEPIPTKHEQLSTERFTSSAFRIRPVVSLSLNADGSMIRHQGSVSVLSRLDRKTSMHIRLSTMRQTVLPESFDRPLLDIAFISTELFGGRLDVGRKYERFGPAYLGGGVLSDGAYPFETITWSGRLKLPFMEWVRVRQVLGYLHGDEHGRRFLLARRWEKTFGSFVIGANEVQISKPFPAPPSFVLPLYPASRLLVRMGRSENSDEIFVSADVAWVDRDGKRVYLEWIVDDVRLAKPAERQMGCIVGAQLPFDPVRKRAGLIFEYAQFDENTFTHANPKLNYQYRGEALGYPTGPNSRVIFGRLDLPISKRTHITLLGAAAQHGRETSPDWEPYFAVQLFHDINPSFSIGVHYTRGMPPRCGKPIHAGAWCDMKERAEYISFEVNMIM